MTSQPITSFRFPIDTLDRFPDTLLGNKELRRQYYNSSKEEIVLSRNSEVFEAVLFYYQSNGILGKFV